MAKHKTYRPVISNPKRGRVYQYQELPAGSVYKHLEEGGTFKKVAVPRSVDKQGKDVIHWLTDKVRFIRGTTNFVEEM